MDGGTLNIKKCVVMYPVYINSKKSVVEGRRISLSKACENPNCIEISDCCKHLKLPSAVEIDKAYPVISCNITIVNVCSCESCVDVSSLPANVVRLQLAWKQLMQKIADLVPRHPERVKKQELQATTLTAGTSSKRQRRTWILHLFKGRRGRRRDDGEMAEEDGGEEDLLETTIASRSGLCCGEDGDDGEQVRAEEEDATACGG
ncbi:hypothetical protein DY000_02010605, partial [Brassica cretica]